MEANCLIKHNIIVGNTKFSIIIQSYTNHNNRSQFNHHQRNIIRVLLRRHLLNDSSTGITVKQNTVINCTKGIYSDICDGNYYNDNTCSNNKDAGIYLYESNYNDVKINHLDHNGRGVTINVGRGNHIGNTVEYNNLTGVAVPTATFSTFDNNAIWNNGYNETAEARCTEYN